MAEKFIDVIKDIEKNTPKSLRKGMGEVGDELLRLSGNKVPLELGTLRGSGKRELKSDTEVEVGYFTPYAAYQHEGIRADGTHKVVHYTTAGTGKKYLERPLLENLSKWGDMIGASLKAGIRK